MKEFGEKCDGIPECKKLGVQKFRRKFSNRADRLRTAMEKPSARADNKPFYLLPDGPETKARDLYTSAHRADINAEANERGLAAGQDHHFQLAHFQQVVAEHWKDLTPAERETWEAKATAKNMEAEASNGSIFENQLKLPRTLFGLLQRTLHASRGGVGVGAYHVLYSYRNSQEEIVVGSLTVNSADSETIPFQTAYIDYKTTTTAPWELYSHQNIGFNKNIDYSKKLAKNAGGFYVLPHFDEETEMLKDFRETLRLFMEGSFLSIYWAQVQVMPRTGAMPAMPWAEFLNHPEDFLQPGLIVDGILTRPDAMPSTALRAFAGCIHKFQAANGTISIFNDENTISAAILDHQARADAAKPEEIVEVINAADVDDQLDIDTPPADNPTNPISVFPPPPPLPPAPPANIPQKRKASGPPPSADVDSSQPAPLRRSSRHNTVPNAKANKRRKTS
ncbi:hypothetical protein DFH09DRAFT_1500090 [Mycena vulgaris]|nr:hypothetical protein DFH09DRAFT_1500090 [Mycena vulgaris]